MRFVETTLKVMGDFREHVFVQQRIVVHIVVDENAVIDPSKQPGPANRPAEFRQFQPDETAAMQVDEARVDLLDVRCDRSRYRRRRGVGRWGLTLKRVLGSCLCI